MIERIQIRGLGVIVDATIPFSTGLTVITGETGAGKTMVLSGFALLAGGKADVGMVRSGSDQAWVDGEWSVSPESVAVQRASDAGAEVEIEDGRVRLLLARTVASEGRSRAFAGGRAVPAGVLQDVSAALVAVHGQSEQIRLRHADTQRNLLDRFAGMPCLEALSNYRAAFASWRSTVERVQHLIDQRESMEREAVLLRIGIAEIDALLRFPVRMSNSIGWQPDCRMRAPFSLTSSRPTMHSWARMAMHRIATLLPSSERPWRRSNGPLKSTRSSLLLSSVSRR